MKSPTEIKRELNQRWQALKAERSSWISHWQEISNYIMPRAGRFFLGDRNRGERVHTNIYDSTATRAHKVLGAGLMSGATSPARPWFKIDVPDPDMRKYHEVKVWLADVTFLMQRVFQKSNTYRALHSVYEEISAFGTAASLLYPDYNTVIHHNVLTAGEYAIACDFNGRVCTLYREFELPVSAIVKEFGLDNVSREIKRAYDNGNLDMWYTIIHAIEPREDREFGKPGARNMPYRSIYYEPNGDADKLLRESGFREFPALAPRWSVSGGDIYGNSPGMEALGDIKQLQHEQLRKAQGIDYKVRPPLQVPNALKNREVDTLPGGLSFYDPSSPTGGVKSLFEVNLDLSHLLLDIQDVRQRINGSFYSDLFLMLANASDSRMTATEVAERHEEKLLMLGPVMERLHNELLSPMIDITFANLLRANVLPKPPDELNGVELTVEFISMLAQAQRAVGANSVDRYVGSLGAVAQFKPGVLDKFDEDEWADMYADMLGVDPRLVLPAEDVALIRQERAKAEQAMQQAAMAEQQSKTVKNLATSPTGEDNVAGELMNQFSGDTSPGPSEV